MVAKKDEGRWRYLVFRLIFSLEGRALRALEAHDDAPLAPPANGREARLVIGDGGNPALLVDPADDRRGIHTRERAGGTLAKRTSILLSETQRAGPPEGYPPRRRQAHRNQALKLVPPLARSPREVVTGFDAWNGLTYQEALNLYPQEC